MMELKNQIVFSSGYFHSEYYEFVQWVHRIQNVFKASVWVKQSTTWDLSDTPQEHPSALPQILLRDVPGRHYNDISVTIT